MAVELLRDSLSRGASTTRWMKAEILHHAMAAAP